MKNLFPIGMPKCCYLDEVIWFTVTCMVFFSPDAQILDITARLTNIDYTEDLQNTSSMAYLNLTASIIIEVNDSSGIPNVTVMTSTEFYWLHFESCNLHY